MESSYKLPCYINMDKTVLSLGWDCRAYGDGCDQFLQNTDFLIREMRRSKDQTPLSCWGHYLKYDLKHVNFN